MKQSVVIALRRPPDLLVPLMQVHVETVHLKGFLDALMGFAKYIPVVAIANSRVITGYDMTSDGLFIRGVAVEEMQA